MSKHTPGPWHLAEVENGSIKHMVPVGPDGYSLCTVVHDGDTPFGAIYMDADARLIAAAPELLEALQMLLEFPNTGPATSAARAAIAKATGERP